MKIRKTDILLFLFIFASYPPNMLMAYSVIKLLCNIIQMIGFTYLLMILIKKRNISSLFMLMFIFNLSLFISTFLGNKQIYRCVVEIFNNLGMPILLTCEIISFRQIVKIGYKYFGLLCSINFLSLLIGVFIKGLEADDSVFIIDSNGITIYYIITIVLTVLYSELYQINVRGRIIYLCLVCSVSEVLVWSGTGMIAWFLFLIIYMWSQKGKKRRIPYFITNIGTNLASIILVLAGVSPIFQSVLDFLGKDATLTGRTYIWAAAISKFWRSPVLGYGYGELAHLQYVAHNQILQLLINGGLLLLVLFYTMYVYIGMKERKLENDLAKSKGVSIMKAALMGIGIDMMTEIEPIAIMFLVLGIFDRYISIGYKNNEYGSKDREKYE
nr:O-antigen ligase family protein [uncultured Mediterraneibacter sp.]